MIHSYKNRTIDYNKPVRVYRNLHNDSYSIKQNGVVVAHSRTLFLKNCKFIINKGGQRRVRETGEKNVHAFIEGMITPLTKIKKIPPIQVFYNPYRDDAFKDVLGKEIHTAKRYYLIAIRIQNPSKNNLTTHGGGIIHHATNNNGYT